TMPAGTPVEMTQAAVDHIEASVDELKRRLDPEYAQPGQSMVVNVLAAVGSQPFLETQSGGPGGGSRNGNGAHLAEVVLGLVPSEERGISTSDIAKHWREIVGAIP